MVQTRYQRHKAEGALRMRLSDLPGRALADVISCVSLPELARMERCRNNKITSICAAALQWAAAGAAINAMFAPLPRDEQYGDPAE